MGWTARRHCGAVSLRLAPAGEVPPAAAPIAVAGIHLHTWERQQVADALERHGIAVAPATLHILGFIPTLWAGQADDCGIVLVRVADRIHLLALQPRTAGRPVGLLRDQAFLRERLAAYARVRQVTEAALRFLEAGGDRNGLA